MVHLSLQQALNSREEELGKDTHKEEEGEGEAEVSWIMHKDEVTCACQYELVFDMGLFSNN